MIRRIANEGHLSFGLVFPIEAYPGSIPQMKNQEELAQISEEIGMKALWFRDVPFNDPSFGDAGQIFDPLVYMTHIMNHTKSVLLGTASLILPLRHPVHTLKSLNSIQKLSGGRVIAGIASGDRPLEYPAFEKRLSDKSALFRDSFHYFKALNSPFPIFKSENFGALSGQIDLLPKASKIPLLVTGHSGQELEWIAEHADGWLYYPRNQSFLKATMSDWHNALQKKNQPWKPYMQSLYIDLLKDDDAPPKGIHLGFQSGVNYLIQFLKEIEQIGVSHVILNLKFASQPVEWVLEKLGASVLPNFEV